MKHGIKYGVIYGVGAIVFTLLLYLINKELTVNTAITLGFSLVFGTALMVVAARSAKAENGGILPFGEALITVFLVFVVGSFITSIFTYILMNYIDPSLVQVVQQRAVEMMEKTASMMGGEMNEDQLDQMREQMEEQSTFNISSVLLGWLTNCVIGLIYSLIVAAIVKKNPTVA